MTKFRLRKPLDKSMQGDLSIEHAENNGKHVYLLVVRNLGKSNFLGSLNAQSKVRRVEERANKNQLKVAVFNRADYQTFKETKDESGNIKSERSTVKVCGTVFATINFSRHEDMTTFESEFQKAVEALKK